MYFMVFSTNLDWGRTSNGLEWDSIKCSIQERGWDGAWSCWVLGHNSAGRNLKTSFIARSKDQVSVSVSKSDSLFVWGRFGWNSSILIGWVLTGLLRLYGNRRLNNLERFFSPFISTDVNLRLRNITGRRRRHRSSSSLFVWVLRSLWFLLSSWGIQRVWPRCWRRGKRRSLSSSLFWISLLDCSFREGLVWETLVELGGSIITLGSDIWEKSGSNGMICLEEVAGFGNSDISECSYPGACTSGSLRILPWDTWLLTEGA